MPVVDSFQKHSQSSKIREFSRDMSQNYTKSSFYASNKMNVSNQSGGNMSVGGMGNRGPNQMYQAVSDGFRYPNNMQQTQQHEYVKPANPPLKMLVPSEMVGAIIGRGGATIREITKASRARVDVHRNYESEANGVTATATNGILPGLVGNAASSEKVISIYGKEGDSISTACKKILEVMDTEFRKIRQNRLECGVPGFMNGLVAMTMPGMKTAMTETALKMLAPNAIIGRIIGKQGKKVNEIKDKSGAKITVSNVYDINAENPERTIIITGNLDAISSAESKISEILRVCHQQESVKFSTADVTATANASRYRENDNHNFATPYSNYLARGGQGVRGGGQSHLVGQPAMMGTALVEMPSSSFGHGGPPMLPHHHTQLPPPPYGNASAMNQENPESLHSNLASQNPNLATVFLYVPANSVGAIIGKKGESVRQITRTTSAIIKIAAEIKDKSEDGVDANAKTNVAGFDIPAPPRDASKTPGEKSVAITASFDAQCRAIAQIFKKLYEERFFGNDPPFLALDLLIPSSQMGKVLGKQKLKIRTIERRTGVNIRVPENTKAASAGGGENGGVDDEKAGKGEDLEEKDSMSYVTIRGTLTQMIQAMSMVKEILHGEPPHMGVFIPPVPMYPPFPRNPPYYPNYRGGRGRARF